VSAAGCTWAATSDGAGAGGQRWQWRLASGRVKGSWSKWQGGGASLLAAANIFGLSFLNIFFDALQMVGLRFCFVNMLNSISTLV
jgi:hypothetical protein